MTAGYETDLLLKIGQYLKDYRERENLTAVRLSQILGIAQSHISRLERGNISGVTLSLLVKVATLEHETVSSFLAALETNQKKIARPPREPVIARLIREIEKLDPKLQGALAEALENHPKDASNRFERFIEILYRLLAVEQKAAQEIEIEIWQSYLNLVNADDQLGRKRLASLLKAKFGLHGF